MKKYVFKSYNKIFPEIFEKEKEKICDFIEETILIEHVGSTSIPNLGGKGIIDIAIASGSPLSQLNFTIDAFKNTISNV